MSAPGTGLKPSDYAQGAAIVTGAIGGSTFMLTLAATESNAATIIGVAGILTTIFTSLSAYLRSKGD